MLPITSKYEKLFDVMRRLFNFTVYIIEIKLFKEYNAILGYNDFDLFNMHPTSTERTNITTEFFVISTYE